MKLASLRSAFCVLCLLAELLAISAGSFAQAHDGEDLWLLMNSTNANQPAADRSTLLQDIVILKAKLALATDQTLVASLREEIKTKESLFLAPAAEDLAQYADFLKQPHTGIIRLMPRERYDGVLNLRGGGAYYSFGSRYQAYGFGSDLSLEQNQFHSGFAGIDYGFLLPLTNVSLDNITPQTSGVDYLASFTPPLDVPNARLQQQRVGNSFVENGFTYSNRTSAELGKIYVARSITYECADVLIAFEPFRRDNDGSLLLRWKLLKRFPTPQSSGSTILTASAASYAHTIYAPGSIVSLFGQALTDGNHVAATLPLPQFFGNTQITVQDSSDRTFTLRTSLFAATPNQINFLLPAEIVEGFALIAVTTSQGHRYRELVNISKTAPGLFSANADGQGVAAAVALRINGNQQSYEAVARFDSAQNKFVAVPLEIGSNNEQLALVLFGTGVRGRNSLDEVSLKIGGVSVPVLYAGAQGSEGLDQINAIIPRELAGSGEVNVVLSINNKTANTVRINIR